tara:strand:- start:115 stop:240 length:126 start_codon:yes stop_codon:yes gene_type:complete
MATSNHRRTAAAAVAAVVVAVNTPLNCLNCREWVSMIGLKT